MRNVILPGHYADTETGLNYNYFRDYDPATGRYVESDPIGLKAGVNTYSYVRGRPLTLSDPSGLLARGNGLSDSDWNEVQKAEAHIRRELGRSCSCHAQGPEGCIPCDLVPDLLKALDTAFVYGRTIAGTCGEAGIFSRYVVVTPDAFKSPGCSCLALTIYHELLHDVGLGHGRGDPVGALDQKCRGNLCK
jgi:RHS repeat-associated protein